ncbi:MAG TPA: hypothetical protein VMJ10_20645 [Kofleriaceae bacterium]|nr:hypothetical protein [Kofleriaceae bacterium]
MRALVLTATLAATPALADPYRVVEDGVMGLDPAPDHALLGTVDTSKCPEPTGAALFWLEIGKAGHVAVAHVHGAGKADACLERALTAARVTDKLPNAIVVVGRVEADGQASPRINRVPIMVDAHGAPWQLTVERVGYTDNRALDIGAALDGASAAIAACASKRGRAAKPVRGIAWTDGHAIVHTGAPDYDACVARALSAIPLPTADSSMWLELAIAPPGEALAPREEASSHATDLRDALTTAVRSRKLHLLGCLDGHPKTALVKLGITLAHGHANVRTVATGDRDADACVREKFHDISIPNAGDSDHLDLDVSLDPE